MTRAVLTCELFEHTVRVAVAVVCVMASWAKRVTVAVCLMLAAWFAGAVRVTVIVVGVEVVGAAVHIGVRATPNEGRQRRAQHRQSRQTAAAGSTYWGRGRGKRQPCWQQRGHAKVRIGR